MRNMRNRTQRINRLCLATGIALGQAPWVYYILGDDAVFVFVIEFVILWGLWSYELTWSHLWDSLEKWIAEKWWFF